MYKIIVPTLSILIALSIFFFFVRPMFERIQTTQEEAGEYQSAVDRANEFNQLLGSLIARKEAIGTYKTERLETFLPSEIDTVQALVDIEALARSRGLIFDNVEVSFDDQGAEDEEDQPRLAESRSRELEETNGEVPPSAAAIENVKMQDVSFDVLGTYGQFKAFLTDLERSLVLTEIVEITFRQEAIGELTNYQLTVRFYAFSEDN